MVQRRDVYYLYGGNGGAGMTQERLPGGDGPRLNPTQSHVLTCFGGLVHEGGYLLHGSFS